MSSKRKIIKKTLKEDEISKFLDDDDEDETYFDKSVGSDDLYVPPQDSHARRTFENESDSSIDGDALIEPQDPLMQEDEKMISASTDHIELESENREVQEDQQIEMEVINKVVGIQDSYEVLQRPSTSNTNTYYLGPSRTILYTAKIREFTKSLPKFRFILE